MNPPHILVAGAGNVFLGDDGFGVAVVARLAREPLPEGVLVRDYGIRSLHLAYELLEPPRLLIVVDALARGQPPGTLFVIERDEAEEAALLGAADPHGLTLPAVFAGVAALGITLPRVLVVGCEPAVLGEALGLSAPVEQAVEPAAQLVRDLIARELPTLSASVPPPPAKEPTLDDVRQT
jgi:hydrogenase maturation protease